MSVYKTVEQVCAELGEPFKIRYVREQLHHGTFRGIGSKHGQTWLLTDDDVVAMLDRMRVPPVDLDTPPNPSGISPRSRRFNQRQAS